MVRPQREADCASIAAASLPCGEGVAIPEAEPRTTRPNGRRRPRRWRLRRPGPSRCGRSRQGTAPAAAWGLMA